MPKRAVVLLMLLGLTVGQGALAAGSPDPLTLKAPSAILIESSSGRVLYEKNADVERPPASMTKLMTLVLAFKALAEGRVTWQQPVSAGEDAVRLGGAQIWLERDEMLPFGELVKAVAVGSANDAAYALGKHLGGTEESFAAQMNREAHSLGLRHTSFKNAHGLDAPGHLSTARDMALLGREAVRWPALVRLTSQWEDRSLRDGKGGKLWLVNPNNKFLRGYPGADGLKTGFTNKAGYCVTATAKRQNLRLVAVVMGEPSAKDRYRDVSALMDYGFSHFRAEVAVVPGRPMLSVPVAGGTLARVHLAAREALYVPRAAADRQPLKKVLHLYRPLRAPVHPGQTVGRLSFYSGAEPVGHVTLVATERVQPLGPLGRLLRFFHNILHPTA